MREVGQNCIPSLLEAYLSQAMVNASNRGNQLSSGMLQEQAEMHWLLERIKTHAE
jgi:hypothetical protein